MGWLKFIQNKYFVVSVTNVYRLSRENVLREIPNFTNNNVIILNYNDRQDGFIYIICHILKVEL